MRSDLVRFYNDEIDRRHRGEHPAKQDGPLPHTVGACPGCGRRALLTSKTLCVQCHTKPLREARTEARRQAGGY